jgi:ATP-binding cassette subfamily F protein 1
MWLQEYLARSTCTLVVTSHDREFLDAVATDIIHIHDQRLDAYRGNFAQFETMFEQHRREAIAACKKHKRRVASARACKDPHARRTQLQAAERAAPRSWRDYTVNFGFHEPAPLATPALLQLTDAGFLYPGSFELKGADLSVDGNSRIAVVGPNGGGKSTLLSLLSGELQPTHGERRACRGLKVATYSQHFADSLDSSISAVEYIMRTFPNVGPQSARAALGSFGLSKERHTAPMGELSGGQKARVVFTRMCLEMPHILLLYEPTNNLDMASIDALADALEAFDGGIVVISHDARLLARICDEEERAEVLVVECGRVRKYDGGFDDYRSELRQSLDQ